MIRKATQFEIVYVKKHLDSSAINIMVEGESLVWENPNAQAKFSSQHPKSFIEDYQEKIDALGW